jgi:hypothetical protein
VTSREDRDLDLRAVDIGRPVEMKSSLVGFETSLSRKPVGWPKPGMRDVSLMMPADEDVTCLVMRTGRAPDIGRDRI